MNTKRLFYYIAKVKPRGQSERYVGDGTWKAANKTIARKEIAKARGVPSSRIKLTDISNLG